MSKLNDTLSEVLDVEPIPEENTAITVVEETSVVLSDSVVETDTEFARTNIRSLVTKGNTAIDEILKVAKASEHPRAYEVAAGFIKTISDLNKDLLQLQKTKKELAFFLWKCLFQILQIDWFLNLQQFRLLN